MGITCCRYCVAPKRHPGCHDKCKEYKEEKEKDLENKRKAREYERPMLTEYDFAKIGYANHKRRKRY